MREKPIFDVAQLNSLSPKELAEALFDQRFKITGNLSAWVKQNREKYDAARKAKLGPTASEQRIEALGPKEPRFSLEEIRCRAKHSRAECKAFFTNEVGGLKDSPAEVRKNDPTRYYELKTAWDSYESPHMEPARSDSDAFPIDVGLATKANLPANIRITETELFQIIDAIGNAEQANQQPTQ